VVKPTDQKATATERKSLLFIIPPKRGPHGKHGVRVGSGEPEEPLLWFSGQGMLEAREAS
jgi:hypothetical protein